MEGLNLIHHSPPTANYFNRGPCSTFSGVSALPRTSNRKVQLSLNPTEYSFNSKKQSQISNSEQIIHHFTSDKQESELMKLKSKWVELINSSYQPVGIEIISSLMNYYAKVGEFDEIDRIVRESVARGFGSESLIYLSALSCYGEVGNLHMMERMIESMVSRCLKVDSLIGNAYIKYHAMFGSLEEMEAAYLKIKSLRILIEKEAIREVACAYISKKKFYKLSEFLRNVGLRRRNAGNLLWNLLLLSYAANFKMKSLQREFLNMVECGFSPDLTTFNIRALAFSRMHMFWDLHLSIKHMKHKGIDPDLVTYGCIVDLYLDKRLARNLSFALGRLDMERSSVVVTDPFVFEGFGKGDFHSTAEVLLESTMGREWTYSKLLRMYLKKKYRSSQIFWNY